ncbi:hypothetical protein GCM10025869_36970 [Homoserinibacter gongjuensis]|uniref:MacB-like periplasmic core domain-containing protein n=1 Tax=Homoserinibacter gongjuensis TaxID=1162968 RepID=A0ABQ6K0Q1_9MICO|nr:hypothetical protein GCM10025869_36970 [Homoserinibacter gongjuensis]
MSRRAATAHGATLTRTPHRIPNPEADLFSLTRMRQHAGVFGSLLVVAAIVSGLALGVLALIDRAAAAGVRGELATHTGEDAALRLSLLLTTEETAADAAVRGLLADAFQRDGAPIPVSVQHEVRTTLGVPVERLDTTGLEGEDATASIVAATIPDLASAATLVAGAWGDGADEATLQADAAAALGLAVGDRLELAGRELTLVGIWRVTDGLAARWVGDALTIRGTDDARLPSFGLLIVDDAVWPSLAEERRDVWTIVPGTDLEAADLAPVVVAWEGIEAGVKGLGVGRSFEKSGHFALTARELDRNVRALDAIGPASLLLVAMIALVTFIELGRLLTEVRTRELGLLWARGRRRAKWPSRLPPRRRSPRCSASASGPAPRRPWWLSAIRTGSHGWVRVGGRSRQESRRPPCSRSRCSPSSAPAAPPAPTIRHAPGGVNGSRARASRCSWCSARCSPPGSCGSTALPSPPTRRGAAQSTRSP